MVQTISEKYTDLCRPELGKFLKLARLDVTYHRAEGDLMYYYDESGKERPIIDFLGGYGASLFGHNNPDLVRVAREFFDQKKVFNAQGSCRAEAAILAEKLDQMMFERIGRHFVTTFASTGTEAIEAAMKHAELAAVKKLDLLQKELAEHMIKYKKLSKKELLKPAASFYEMSMETLGLRESDGLDKIFAAILEYNRVLFLTPPQFISMKKSFHGKTTGSVQLTYNENYRLPFHRIGPRSIFIDPLQIQALDEQIKKAELKFLGLEVHKNELHLVEKSFFNITALFVEPLQGEGGIHIISKEVLKQCRITADKYHFPLVFDEIQSGMGRTGTFLFSEQSGVNADYYTLSKSLGGGLSKISALLIDQTLYEKEFSLIHTSTFAEDGFSAYVALASLKLLEDSDLMKKCRNQSEKLKTGLKRLWDTYPDIIDDVRGQGLMLAVQFKSQSESGSNLIRVICRENYLGYVIAGHLLHESQIRVAPTLSSNSTIRLEPSAYISDESIAVLLQGIERVCEILHKENSFELIKYMVRPLSESVRTPIIDYGRSLPSWKHDPELRRVAFLGHFIFADHLTLWDRSLENLNSQERKELIDRLYEHLGPIISDPIIINSGTGEKVEFIFIGLAVDSDIMYRSLKQKNLKLIREKISQAVDSAVDLGCSMIGLGSYTSIVTLNGKSFTTDSIAITTGNSLTVKMGLEAIFQASSTHGIELRSATAGVVGATGNIGSIYSIMLAEKVPELILFGRAGKEKDLEKVAADIYHNLVQNIILAQKSGTGGQLAGMALKIKESRTLRKYLQTGIDEPELKEKFYQEITQEFGKVAPVKISTDLNNLKHCQIILSASNDSNAIIFPEMLGDGPVIINDISVPMDTDERVFTEKKNVTVILGGIIRLPDNPEFYIDGFPLDKGMAYACMSETILLGMEGITENFSYGNINKHQVEKIGAIAKRHGFELGKLKTERSY
ncbi:MAG TPA: aminotransferase class III-fold pyridoxal phosphate-dependent enzyme [Bacillota bacterium]|nr:aminotransferase class III-fold pyridoxal phosphate-dependent enzyme [Bacillota bacterium]